jgi:Cu+-exporting ATPase
LETVRCSTRCPCRRRRCTRTRTNFEAAVDGRAAGLIGVADPIKDSAVDALKALRADGI